MVGWLPPPPVADAEGDDAEEEEAEGGEDSDDDGAGGAPDAGGVANGQANGVGGGSAAAPPNRAAPFTFTVVYLGDGAGGDGQSHSWAGGLATLPGEALPPVAPGEVPPGGHGRLPRADGSVGGCAGEGARLALAAALVGAYFGVAVSPRSAAVDGWLLAGIRRHVAATAVRSMLGRNWFRFWSADQLDAIREDVAAAASMARVLPPRLGGDGGGGGGGGGGADDHSHAPSHGHSHAKAGGSDGMHSRGGGGGRHGGGRDDGGGDSAFSRGSGAAAARRAGLVLQLVEKRVGGDVFRRALRDILAETLAAAGVAGGTVAKAGRGVGCGPSFRHDPRPRAPGASVRLRHSPRSAPSPFPIPSVSPRQVKACDRLVGCR